MPSNASNPAQCLSRFCTRPGFALPTRSERQIASRRTQELLFAKLIQVATTVPSLPTLQYGPVRGHRRPCARP